MHRRISELNDIDKIEFDVLSAVARRCGSLEQAAEKAGIRLML